MSPTVESLLNSISRAESSDLLVVEATRVVNDDAVAAEANVGSAGEEMGVAHVV
jgi:hypothetical protein